MIVGQIFLDVPAGRTGSFCTLVESLDRLAVRQHVLVGEPALARRLEPLPFVTVGPVVRSPVMANCLLPGVDIVHAHDERSGQAGLLLLLTRSVPFVMSAVDVPADVPGPLADSVRRRASDLVDPAETDAGALLAIYRRALAGWSEFPQDANGRQ